jgi:hypothetical protein
MWCLLLLLLVVMQGIGASIPAGRTTRDLHHPHQLKGVPYHSQMDEVSISAAGNGAVVGEITVDSCTGRFGGSGFRFSI